MRGFAFAVAVLSLIFVCRFASAGALDTSSLHFTGNYRAYDARASHAFVKVSDPPADPSVASPAPAASDPAVSAADPSVTVSIVRPSDDIGSATAAPLPSALGLAVASVSAIVVIRFIRSRWRNYREV
jgi:hypothetical protein